MSRAGYLPSPVDQPTSPDDYELSAAFRVGGFVVHHLSDAFGMAPRRSWFDGADESEWTSALGLSDPETRFPFNFGLFVIVGPEEVTLVDTGFGPKAAEMPGLRAGGELMERLGEIGVDPGDVSHIVQTHLHVDHCGHLTRGGPESPTLTFPNARVHVHRTELDHWTSSATDNDPMAGLVRSKIEAVRAADKLASFTALTRISHGVVAMPFPGHTPGHVCVLVADGDDRCLLVGDLAHHPIHFEHPTWVHELEYDREASLASRQALCELAIGLNAIVTGPHMPILTLGRLARAADGATRWARVDDAELRASADQ